jgi:hypothetical protein
MAMAREVIVNDPVPPTCCDDCYARPKAASA